MSVTVSGSLGALTVSEPTRLSHVVNQVNVALNGEVGVWQTQVPTNGQMFNNTGIAAAFTKVDGRYCKTLRPTLVTGQSSEIRLGAVTYPLSFRRDFANGGTGALETKFGDNELCCVFQAWLRKFNNVDQTSARQFFGFLNNNAAFLAASAVPARTGMMGDGVTGFRFGSNSCPDGAAGAIALAAIDVGSVQPLPLVQPALNWFHVRIKMIPATPTSGGKIVCYLNGQVVASFDAVANLPRGSNGANLQYGPIGAAVVADFDGAIQLGGFHVFNAEFWYDKDYGVAF